MLNHRWIIADYSDGEYWGEVLIKYFIDDNEQVQESLFEGKVGDVNTPNLICMVNFKVPEQVGADILCMVTLTDVRPGKQGSDVHKTQQAPNPLSVYVVAKRVSNVVSQFPVTPCRMS